MTRSISLLVAATLAFWAATAYPAFLLLEDAGLVFTGVAAVLCLVPTAATLLWSRRALQSTPEMQLLAVMGGMFVRIVFAVGAAMVLYGTQEYFQRQSFWLCVVLYYLVTLTVEMGLIVSRQNAALLGVSRSESEGKRET